MAVVSFVLVLTLAIPPSADAASCDSVATVAADVWKQYRNVVEFLGCKTKLGGWQEYHLCSATRLINESHEDLVGWWNAGAKNRWSTIGPRILGPEIEYGIVVFPTQRTFVSMVPSFNQGSIIVRGKSGRAKVTICAVDGAGKSYKLVNDESVAGPRTFSISRHDAEGRILSVIIDAVSPSFKYEIEKQEDPIKWNFGAIRGLADLHVHGAANLGFAGLWTWGNHDGPQNEALQACRPLDLRDGVSLATLLNGASVVEKAKLHAIPMNWYKHADEEVVVHGNGFASGSDAFKNWPHFSDIAHMQVHTDWLREAHRNGLQLIVMSAVNNELLCRMLRAGLYQGDNKYACDDMSNLHRQIDAFNKLDEKYDWFEIALTPWHARKIIHEGNLAVVLSAESSHMLPPSEGDFTSQLEKLYQKGLRSLQIVHERDNRFAGAAPHRENFWWHQRTSNPFAWVTTTRDDSPFELDANGKNLRGLSEAGRQLLGAMIQRRMLIDVSHYSERSVNDLYELVTKQYDRYPFFASHTRFASRLHKPELETLKEFLTTDAQIAQIKAVGGMVGIRTGPNHIVTDPASSVANDCPGSSRSYAQLVSYARQMNLAIAFGSDFNGVTQQLGPRVGDESCYAAREVGRGEEVWNKSQPSLPHAARRFETEGLRHIAYLPDLYKDLVALNTNGADSLNDGAENFIKMWEKAYAAKITKVVNSANACQVDDDCGTGKWCNAGIDTTKNSCEPLKNDNESCAAVGGGHQCKGGHCKFARCYTPNSVAMGGTCYVDDACKEGKCNAIDGTKGTCVCKEDTDCGTGKWCDAGLDLKTNVCRSKLDKGESCGQPLSVGNDHKCKSGECSGAPFYKCK
jgi:microsomal dipeptidase-like Zn-dependent dipeptidase